MAVVHHLDHCLTAHTSTSTNTNFTISLTFDRYYITLSHYLTQFRRTAHVRFVTHVDFNISLPDSGQCNLFVLSLVSGIVRVVWFLRQPSVVGGYIR
jgi:hypothetical protein